MPAPPSSLPPVIAALMAPGVYPERPREVRLIETHISFVLLVGDVVYKIKKPVDLGFLDFSTLERRRHFCEEEVRLNRRLAPELYLGVVGIGGTPEQPVLGGGIPFEFAVKMRRFPQASQLDRMLAARTLVPGHLDAFAQLVADFHESAEVAAPDSGFGVPQAVYRPVEDNFQALRAALAGSKALARLDPLEAWSMSTFLGLRDAMAQRREGGRVRECHGDLHLRNMAWVDGRPLAFDCIEFAPELRWIDVISEVAFLIMDLQARDQWALAARFLNRYLEHTGDYAGVALLPFYQAYRATVRAKVDAIRLGQADVAQEEQIDIERECQHYLELASRYSTFTAPGLMITRGPSGSGKTTWSNMLVEGLGAIRIRSDVERKRLFGLRAEQSAAAGPGEGIYTAEAGRATYEKLLELSAELLDAGYPVIVDAVFAREEQRQPFRQLAEQRGAPFLILDFQASGNVLRERLVERGKDASDADLAVLDRQLAAWQPLVESERTASLAIDTEQAWTGEKLAAEVREALASG